MLVVPVTLHPLPHLFQSHAGISQPQKGLHCIRRQRLDMLEDRGRVVPNGGLRIGVLGGKPRDIAVLVLRPRGWWRVNGKVYTGEHGMRSAQARYSWAGGQRRRAPSQWPA